MFVHFYASLTYKRLYNKIIIEHNHMYRLISSDRTNVVSRSVMKNVFYDTMALTTGVYACEYRRGKIGDVGDNQTT